MEAIAFIALAVFVVSGSALVVIDLKRPRLFGAVAFVMAASVMTAAAAARFDRPTAPTCRLAPASLVEMP